jgi:hypothetical protein
MSILSPLNIFESTIQYKIHFLITNIDSIINKNINVLKRGSLNKYKQARYTDIFYEAISKS